MRFLRFVFAFFAIAALSVIVARILWPLPDISNRAAVLAEAVPDQGPLSEIAQTAARMHPGKSGVISLEDGMDAMTSRLAMIDAAESSIDAQYYIWHDDVSGVLLLDALKRAAARGVRVRLLLDDNGVPGLDAIMATLDAQPNFDIRLFNPSTVRQPKLLGYAFDFFRMNRRMHNKSIIADGALAIIGGRNIGDEYFQIGEQFYADLDVWAAGKIVPETAAVFDAYWNSASVFDLETIFTRPTDLPAFEARVNEISATAQAAAITQERQNSFAAYEQGALQAEWTDVQVVADDPVKGAGTARWDDLMIIRLGDILGDVIWRLDLVSAYFVPGEKGTDYLTGLAGQGKAVNILTNALDTTDVLMVHAGYTKYRRALLDAGINLFELKLRGESAVSQVQLKPFGLSGASLHAKTFAIDNARIFIGSFNFDPRSALLNCEMGFLIDSPTLATRIGNLFDTNLARVSYRPKLTPEGRMVWSESDGETTEIWQQEPGATKLQQVMLTIIGILPVEWLL